MSPLRCPIPVCHRYNTGGTEVEEPSKLNVAVGEYEPPLSIRNSMVVSIVPLIGGRYHSNHPIGNIYKSYISGILREPETTIEETIKFSFCVTS